LQIAGSLANVQVKKHKAEANFPKSQLGKYKNEGQLIVWEASFPGKGG